MAIFIEGTAYPIDKKNVNGWGVPEAEAENAISSLKSSVLKICPGEGHLCDFSEDPYGRIGHAVAAWRDGGEIKVRYQVTDSIAERKIKEGTWKDLGWSTYGEAQTVDDEGWAHGFKSKTMTLVKNPAWKDASWAIAAAYNGLIGLRSISNSILISSEGDPITQDLEKRIGELEKQLEEKDRLIAELQPKADTAGTLETQVSELTASNASLEKELGEKKTLIASLEKTKAVSMTTDEAQKLVASELEKYKAELKAEQERTEAFKAFAAAREKLGLETKPEDYKTLAASELSKLAEDLGGIKISASGQMPRYPANSKTTTSVGRYDSVKKEWV